MEDICRKLAGNYLSNTWLKKVLIYWSCSDQADQQLDDA